MELSFYGEGTTCAELPHPPISLSIYLVVEEALCVAWDYIRTHPRSGFNLLSETEDVITQELYERLYDKVFNRGVVDGFDRQLFTDIIREPKIRSYDWFSLDKMPDMLIRLLNRDVDKPSQDGLFVECKPVDSSHSTGVHYCDKGIIRFVRGEYAWAMTSALMIGYARDGYSILPKLTKALEEREKTVPTIAPPCPCQQSKPGKNNEVVHVSQHLRTFSYVETGQKAPAITLRHLWLRRD